MKQHVWFLVSNSLNAVAFTTVLLCLVSLTEGVTSAVVPGERYRGPVVRVVGIIGQQQCVRECRHRPKLCRGVNYQKQKLLCELVSAINETESNPDYVRIELDQTGHIPVDCLSCSTDDLCVTLSSKEVHCIRDNGSPTDCTSLHNINCGLPCGLYRVRLPYIGHVTVFCEMEKDGGGWTVFQRRQDGSEDFYRTWTEYKNGFGNLGSEFWLGNHKLHNLLSQGTYEMRMDMEDFDNQTRYVKYSSFNVGNESSKYTVTLSGFSGDVDDCFTSTTLNNPINNMKFSTWDDDNDLRSGNCAFSQNSGWWHKSCSCSNPNGLYLRGETSLRNEGLTYVPWRSGLYSLKVTQLMVRRVN
ncbi:ficolin-2-like [Crassostrea angulata]|uniref:ficolin-2-like n=1 Tax=Magallana angulata TaxID=2784310 RepID=UPI0022B13E54|nr:ficolin-2-like [Crassostrea angulata]